MSSRYASERIKEIEELTRNTIPTAIKGGIGVDQYLCQYRMTLNLTIIQAIFGIEFTPKKDGKMTKVKFKHKLATASELATISRLLNEFISKYEKDFLYNSEYECFADAEDDIDIPNRNIDIPLPTLDKVNNKNINEYIFGTSSKYGTSTSLITAMDIYDLAATAEKIKKVKNRNTVLLIGGITLVVAGGAIATICIANNKKKEKEIDESIDDIDDINIDEINADDIDMDMDVPQIDI